jgi:hypothetical protein
LSIEASGFQKEQLSQFDLLARETRRLDVTLKVGTQAESVNVRAEVADVQTDTTVVAETKTGRELVDLPVAIATRAAGSTSTIYTLTMQTGVQTDANGNISVTGGNPSQLSLTIDGISTMGAKASEQLPSSFLKAKIRASSKCFRLFTASRRSVSVSRSVPLSMAE